MDKTLQRLLNAELEAEKIAEKAEIERERIIKEALLEARAEEELFETRVPELHASFIDKASGRADQTIAELKKRYDERHAKLRQQAEQREKEALTAAFNLLIDPASDEPADS